MTSVFANAASKEELTEEKHMPGEVVVKFTEKTTEDEIKEYIGENNIQEIEDIYNSVLEPNIDNKNVNEEHRKVLNREVGKTYRIVLSDKSDEKLYQAIEKLEKAEKVEYVETNSILSPCNTTPNDYNGNTLWGLKRIEIRLLEPLI